MVADALTKAMEAFVLLSVFGARKHTCGARRPNAAMLASVMFVPAWAKSKVGLHLRLGRRRTAASTNP
eukprot:3404000-Pyramimonas_sp.AAC.1